MNGQVLDFPTTPPHTISGSEAAAACGVDPYRSRVALWLEKQGRWSQEPNEAMRWGNVLEPVVFAELERDGWNVMPAPAEGFTDAPDKPWLIGHPDGFAEIDGKAALLEIKTAGTWAAKDWQGDSKAPLSYLVQLHHYFELTGYSLALLAVLIGGQRLETRVVQRDDAVIAAMLEAEQEFIDLLSTVRDVADFPTWQGSQAESDILRDHFQPQPGTVVRADKATEAHVREARILRESMRVRKEQLARHEQAIQAAMGEATELVSRHDTTLAKWTPYERRALDAKALKATLPHVHDEFSTTTTLRRFTLE